MKGLLLTVTLLAAGSRGAQADTQRAVLTPPDALAGTAAIVEGNVKGFTYTFDPAAGPRTIATLSDVTTDFGSYRDTTLQVATLGGPINEKQGLFIPELPRLTDDTRYLIFLNNITWFFSPVVENYVFRIELNANGTEVLIAPTGHAVVGLSSAGLVFTPDPVVDTHVDFLTPTAKLPLIGTTSNELATAMPKTTFLAIVQRLLATTPLQGEFSPVPDSTRVWNVIGTVQEPLRSASH
ncbi:MAG TPA: hypothetical protein VH988_26960 [Thermoanaerobaculia bacterium]|nr:hypothetical protein [Thermoanaerobaculia bacterium]